MKKKKIISIEDRIPKLKQARKKKANRRLISYLSIFFILISIIVYLQSPLSHIKTIEVTGNSFLPDEEVIEQSKLTKKTNVWTINKAAITELISGNPVVKSVEVNRKLPWTVEIQLIEHERVGYIKKGEGLYPILENGTTLPVAQNSNTGDAPLLLDFTEKEYINRMTKELKQLPTSILNVISEIYWNPTKENKNKILLYMNDGFMVDGTIRDFSNKMQIYPSIVSQLDPKENGVIHIGVGAYFEKTENKTDKKEKQE